MRTVPTTLSVAAALRQAVARLEPAASAALDAQLLLGHVLQRSRGALLARDDMPVPAALRIAFEAAVARRATGEPLAYITGRREFWSLDLAVSAAVLVPRPETELVVERALALCGAGPADVADLGTGSGAIALALGLERPRWRLTATDVSTDALRIARTNARTLRVRNLQFRAGRWYEPLEGLRFALILSNPPYIREDDPALADPALRHEPHRALSSGPTGLEALAALVAGAPDYLSAQGWIVLEHGADQSAAVADLLVARGFRHVRCHRDLAGLPRVTEGQRSWRCRERPALPSPPPQSASP